MPRYLAPVAILSLAACVPPAPEPTPAPPQAPPAARATPPAPQQPAALTPAPREWIDAPQSPGDWSYGPVDGGSLARFGRAGDPVFGIGCMSTSRRIVLVRYGSQAGGDTPMIVRTRTLDRTLSAQPAADRRSVSAAVPARDPLLDAMAFSRGRFAVEVAAMPALYLPAWPEVTRVIEDCR